MRPGGGQAQGEGDLLPGGAIEGRGLLQYPGGGRSLQMAGEEGVLVLGEKCCWLAPSQLLVWNPPPPEAMWCPRH